MTQNRYGFEVDLESDLIKSKLIVNKVRASEQYAQNLYAALCNNTFYKLEVWRLLKNDQDNRYLISWRGAGALIAELRGEGDYMDWYCSGSAFGVEDNNKDNSGYVCESVITDEIRADLNSIGWGVK